MKKLFLIITLIFGATEIVDAQKSKWPALDKSPMDMIVYPGVAAWRNYMTGDDRNATAKMRVMFARPSKNDREIFGGLVPYGKEWRLGANEASEITFYQTTSFADVVVPRGIYSIFVTPEKDNWTISLSSQMNMWGGAKRDMSKTVASFKVPTEQTKEVRENLAMAFQKVDEENANLVIEWDMTRVVVPVNFHPVVFPNMDASPMDRAMYPSAADGLNYVEADKLDASQPKIRVQYGRPQVKGRTVFGELLKYGEVWRLGANESTVIRFYQDVTVAGTDIKKGSYNLYATVNEQSWDLIFNTDMPAWGAANRNEEKDVAQVNIPITTESESIEALSIIFDEKSANEVHMIIGWDKVRAAVPITIK